MAVRFNVSSGGWKSKQSIKGAGYESQGQRAPLRLRAKGARYKSQGQARSASPLVSDNKKSGPALKARNTYFGLSGLNRVLVFVTRGDALRACPWLSYLAPLARRQRREGKGAKARREVRGIQSIFTSEVIFPPLQLAKGSFNSMLLTLPRL